MKLAVLVALTMIAFAANSILTRLALLPADTGPASFAAIRLVSGALVLGGLVALRRGAKPQLGRGAWTSAASLLVYAIGFSFAYVSLPAGVGALILFGGVQITMFAVSLVRGERIAGLSWVGTAMAFAGLAYLLWPTSQEAPDAGGTALMLAAAIAWGLYTVQGRGSRDPLGATALAFVCAAPFGVALWAVIPDSISAQGAVLAVMSGALTSGLGYALWYRVLPHLGGPTAAVAQLSVPVIAAFAGAALLAEPLTLRLIIASTAVLAGIGVTVLAQRKA